MFYYYFDYTYIFVIIGAVISMIAAANVRATYNKYSKYGTQSGLTSQEAASRILKKAGIKGVQIDHVRGSLTDHYSPGNHILRLSDSVGNSNSIAAIGVAAHECGHAIQDQENYGPLRLRTAAVPIANYGSWFSWPLILLGLLFQWSGLILAGIVMFLFVVAFQLITLPVEFDASRRALKILKEDNMLTESEMVGARKVLTAAAMTYVAALFTSILQLVRLILLFNGTSRRR